MTRLDLSRRGLITGGALTLGGLLMAGCDRLSQAPSFQKFTGSAEGLTYRSQRLLLSGQQLAREYSERDMSPVFKANGTMRPASPVYRAMAETGFADWRLRVEGLVARPFELDLAELRALPARTQITRHDCVEGWSAIGKWTGPQLGALLERAGLAANARFVVFHCADNLGGEGPAGLYYESIDLIDAFHPQTILAHTMNDAPLAVAHRSWGVGGACLHAGLCQRRAGWPAA